MEGTFSVYRKIDNSPSVAVEGQVLTKPHIVDLMLDLANYTGEGQTTLLDPGCGHGAFIVAAARRLVRSQKMRIEFDDVCQRLLGIEKDDAAVDVCRGRMSDALCSEGVCPKLAGRLAERWIIAGDFLEHAFDQPFDFVVGNPPYVRQEAISKEQLERYRVNFDCFYDRADLYVAFFERALKLLAEQGRLALICPDRFAKNQYGKKLRALISQRFSVECVVDLAQASPFEPDVTCYPGIYVVRRAAGEASSGAAPKRHVDYFRLTDASPDECHAVRRKQSNGEVTYHRYDGWFVGEQQWSIESPEHLSLLRRLESECISLGEASSGCRVGIGVATGADDVFIVDRDFDGVERELLMPLVTTKDIAGGSVAWSGQYVIDPFVGDTPRLIDLRAHPKARAYFETHRTRLEGRNVAQRDRRRWYRTIDRIYPDLQTRRKLLIPDIKAENLIVLEDGKLYPHHNLYYVASDYWDLRALRTILRSSVGKFFVWMYGVKMRGDYLRFQAQYLRRICIPPLMTVGKRMVDKLRAVDDTSDQEEIDAGIAELYGLTDKEMSLIRRTAVPRRQR
jgi:methylase of polypeptide subunit release factors